MVNWKLVSDRKKGQVNNSIPEEWQVPGISLDMESSGFLNTSDYLDTILPPNEKALTTLSASELASRIHRGELSSYKVCYAFCHRAALAHQILNCCTEIFFDKALKRAKELDNIFEVTKTTVGPLHGIPVSLKDQINLPELDSAIGYVALSGKKSTSKSLIANVLEEMGAVFYVKTTVPTAMIASETVSNLHGYTRNAINLNFTSGGSSGGEGALIGAGGSVLGVGTDIAGSIRIPASFQGLYGLKPSYGRIPYMNVKNSYAGQEIMPSVIGPMARSLADLEMFARAIVSCETWNIDPNIVPIPWRDMSFLAKRKLRLGFLWDDHLMKPHPPITRALEETFNALKFHGHEIVQWDFPYQKDVLDLAKEVLGADGGHEVKLLCEEGGEPILDCLKYAFPSLNDESSSISMGVNEWWKLAEKKNFLKEKFLEHWRETANATSSGEEIDAIISPVWPFAGFEAHAIPFDPINYTVPINLLDCTSVVLPVTTVDVTVDKKEHDYIPTNEDDASVKDYYDLARFDKMPVCIRVVCKRMEEEKALAISSAVLDCLKGTFK